MQANTGDNTENIQEIDDIEEVSGNIFSVDHSKRGTAKSMASKKSTLKDDLRIGKSEPYKSIHI